MAPRRREKPTTTPPKRATIETRRITRSIYKKQQMIASQQEEPSKIIESSRLVEDENEEYSSTKNEGFDGGCSTPKSEKYKVPEIMTCPPAPKKPRRTVGVSVSSSKNCLAPRRRPITFFTHPDLDKFFTFAASEHIKV